MTEQEFCRIESDFSGEKVDKIEQIKERVFTGEELKEYVEFVIEQTKFKTLIEFTLWLNDKFREEDELRELIKRYFKNECPQCGCNALQEKWDNTYTCLRATCNWNGEIKQYKKIIVDEKQSIEAANNEA